MEAALQALEATGLAQALRMSRWGYAGLSAAHILALALLVGAILPLDLRLMGAWPRIPRAMLARVLVPFAALGLLLAMATGALLFSVRATEYAALGVFQLKLGLVAAGTLAALTLHAAHGWQLVGAPCARLRLHALVSASCWLGALVCGRLIGFAD